MAGQDHKMSQRPSQSSRISSSRRYLSTACAVSTETRVGTFDLDANWAVHPQVSIRPERFGALLYHFGTRQLSFLKSPKLLAVACDLATASSARGACTAAGVTSAEMPSYHRALAALAASEMICETTSQ
jgi:putative mycofactocin binding protein MftB